ncbi:hypothetical protein BFJ72_g10042 [Fusarium proliferatum]|uniref:Zn(2)-C6 fungal-type domain-containing protein n=1 Tax=Gibberella intermedia TaxID=948311 RepID=A0A420SW50_GIBIN|nr:hypothetical protein BFJ72_g10042 [Fusarium proliferatum]
MADTSDKAPFSPGARPLSPRVVTRQACDNCRIRKRKCSFASDEGIRWATVPCAPKPGTRCRNCTKADSQCTFLLPSKARGPKTRRNLHHNAAQHSVSPENSLNLDSELVNQLSPFTTESSPSTGITAYATDILFPRELVRFILGDYVTYVYPLIPVIHQPTFQLDFDSDRDMHDVDFLALIISLCAVTVSLLPSRFKTYRSFSSPLPFETRTEMADQCYKLNQSFRDTTYFDTVSHQKWASTFLLGVAFHQTVNNNLWRMLEVESMQLLRLLEVQHLSSYSGLDAVEIQLRKKAFWLMFYGYVHQMYNLRNERLMFLDPATLSDLDIEGLMPNAVDDEFISCTGVLPCPEDVSSKSLTAGFNIHSRVFAAAVISPRLTTHPAPDLCHPKDPVSRLDSLKNRLHHLKYMLDTIVPAYRPWLPRTHDPDPEGGTDVRASLSFSSKSTSLAFCRLQDPFESCNSIMDRLVMFSFELPPSVSDTMITAKLYVNIDDEDIETVVAQTAADEELPDSTKYTSVSSALHILQCRRIQSEIFGYTLHWEYKSRYEDSLEWRLQILNELESCKARVQNFTDP